MTKTEGVKALIMFLKEHGAYYRFIKYFLTSRNIETRNRWIIGASLLGWEYLPKGDLINCAFIWPETKEGTNYWSNLADEWKKICNDELRKEKEEI